MKRRTFLAAGAIPWAPSSSTPRAGIYFAPGPVTELRFYLESDGSKIALRLTPTAAYVHGVKYEPSPEAAKEVFEALRVWMAAAGVLCKRG